MKSSRETRSREKARYWLQAGSPIPQVAVQNHPPDALVLAELFKGIITAIKATSDSASGSKETSSAAVSQIQPDAQDSELIIRASKVEVKEVYEMYVPKSFHVQLS
jgi:hypothetical protein